MLVRTFFLGGDNEIFFIHFVSYFFRYGLVQ